MASLSPCTGTNSASTTTRTELILGLSLGLGLLVLFVLLTFLICRLKRPAKQQRSPQAAANPGPLASAKSSGLDERIRRMEEQSAAENKAADEAQLARASAAQPEQPVPDPSVPIEVA